jgi:hypothetical protein
MREWAECLPSPAAVTQANLRSTSRSRHGTIDRETNLNAACECDQIGPEERVYSRFFSQEQAIIAEMRMAAYLMLEGLGMIRGWLRNLHAAL